MLYRDGKTLAMLAGMAILLATVSFKGKPASAQSWYQPGFSPYSQGGTYGWTNGGYAPLPIDPYSRSYGYSRGSYGLGYNQPFAANSPGAQVRDRLLGSAFGANGNPLQPFLSVFTGKGSFTSRLLRGAANIIPRAYLIHELTGGKLGRNAFDSYANLALQSALGMPIGGPNLALPLSPYSAGNQTYAPGYRPGAFAKLTPCEQQKQFGVTQAVSTLNKDLIRILY